MIIVRQPLNLESITGKLRDKAGSWEHEVNADPKIHYVAINSFVTDTATDLEAIVSSLQEGETKGLVIDLRNSPGGMLQTAVDCADLFLDEGVIVQVRGRNENSTYRANSKQLLKGIPIAILTNQTTASAAEIFAGALQDHGTRSRCRPADVWQRQRAESVPAEERKRD